MSRYTIAGVTSIRKPNGLPLAFACDPASAEAIVAELNALREQATEARKALGKIAHGGPYGTGYHLPWDVAREALSKRKGAIR